MVCIGQMRLNWTKVGLKEYIRASEKRKGVRFELD